MIISYLYIYMDGAPSLHLIPLQPAPNPPFPAVAGSVPAFFCGCCCCPVCGLRLRCSGLDHPCDCLRCCEASWLTLAVGGGRYHGGGGAALTRRRETIYLIYIHTHTHIYIEYGKMDLYTAFRLWVCESQLYILPRHPYARSMLLHNCNGARHRIADAAKQSY